MPPENSEHNAPLQDESEINQVPTSKTKSKLIYIIFIPLTIVALIILVVIYMQRATYSTKSFEKTENETSSEQIQTPESKKISIAQKYKEVLERVEKYYTEPLQSQTIYTSSELGVSLIYMKGEGDNEISLKEIDNKIYIYPTVYGLDSGQYLEVFQKNANETLKEALERIFLQGFDPNECYAYMDKAEEFYPEGYILGNIQLTGDINMNEIALRYQNCPKIYTKLNGTDYFLTDKNHPERFIFISTGHYAISYDREDPYGGWENSIRFLD